MKRLKVVGLLLAAVFVLSAAVSASASAAGTPEFSTQTGWTGTGGKATFTAGTTTLKCEKSTSEGSMEASKVAGKYTITFKTCTSAGLACNSLGSAAGTIVIGGTWHMEFGLEEEALIWLLVPSTHIECPELKTLLSMSGGILGSVTPKNTESKEFTVAITATKEKQGISEFMTEEGGTEVISLQTEINGGKATPTTVESAETKLVTEKVTEMLAGFIKPKAGTENPLKIKEKKSKTITMEYIGVLTTGLMSVAITNTKNFTEKGGTCEKNAGLKSGGTCTVIIECKGKAGEKGEVIVKGAGRAVRAGRNKLECE